MAAGGKTSAHGQKMSANQCKLITYAYSADIPRRRAIIAMLYLHRCFSLEAKSNEHNLPQAIEMMRFVERSEWQKERRECDGL